LSTIGVKFKMAEDDANLFGDELLDKLTGFDEHLETVESLNSGNERRAEEIKSRNISHFVEDIIQSSKIPSSKVSGSSMVEQLFTWVCTISWASVVTSCLSNNEEGGRVGSCQRRIYRID